MAEKPTRSVFVNEASSSKYAGNKISTTKYNLFTFIPRFLFEQFRKYANIYFLSIVLLQQIPDVSPTGRFTTLVPLCVILSISAIREIIEDLRRKHSDDTTNRKTVSVMRRGTWKPSKWKLLKVGDVVKVSNDEYFPADLVILSSSEPSGMCYIETSNLDGETNLKVRQAIHSTLHFVSDQDLTENVMNLDLNPPNKYLYDFVGNIQVNKGEKAALGPDQLLLRGARLKNTTWVYAVIVYAGYETKLMLNSNKIPLKRSTVDTVVNRQVIMMFCLLLVLSWASAIGSYFFTSSLEKKHWYIGFGADNAPYNLLYSLFTFIILYNNLIPISLQVTLEMVKFTQAVFIGWDLDMFCDQTNTSASARTSNLNEELGQIKYIFSDKTGTLTCNIMTLKYCYVAGITYWKDFVDEEDEESELGELKERRSKSIDARERRSKSVDGRSKSLRSLPSEKSETNTARLRRIITSSDILMSESLKSQDVYDFMVMCAICHTVVPEIHPVTGEIHYLAASPDERALVLGAKKVGVLFVKRTVDSITIKVADREQEYQLLNIIEFTSNRKRMTAIVRDPKGKIIVMVKGADTIVMELLSGSYKKMKDEINEQLSSFSTLGMRTLCFGQKTIHSADYKEWNEKFLKASTSMKDREQNIEKVAEIIEKNLHFIGISAIEDKLQDGVPETINKLLQAGIKIWVLTGDKQETAINIGLSSKLITAESEIVRMNHETLQDTKSAINIMKLRGPWKKLHGTYRGDEALVIDGKTLAFALHKECSKDFVCIATNAKVVICCRVSPSQKSEIVRLVKNEQKAITLSIGDGANDVGMIQEAHVGVGISGQEGLQAVCASDYSISQFRFLDKLLLVHGHWNYCRVTKLILFSFYKNICFYFCEFWYAMLSAFSGQIIFERWTIGLYNVVFTAMPPLAIGIFDQTASADTLLENPHLYKLPQSRTLFNVKIFWMWCINAIYVSLIMFWVPCGALQHDNVFSDGKVSSLFYVGNIIYSVVIVTICIKALIEMNYWNKMVFILTMGSVCLWFSFLPIYCNLWPHIYFAEYVVGMDYYLFTSPMFYFIVIIVPLTALFRDIACKIFFKNSASYDDDLMDERDSLAENEPENQVYTQREIKYYGDYSEKAPKKLLKKKSIV